MRKKVIKLINNEHKHSRKMSVKACDTSSQDLGCRYPFDYADCFIHSYDKCTRKDYSSCVNYAYDVCAGLDDYHACADGAQDYE